MTRDIMTLNFGSIQEEHKFEALYNKYKQLVYRYAFNIMKRHTLADDAASEAWIRICRNLHKVNEEKCNDTVNYLVTIVKNVSYTIIEKENKTNPILFDDVVDYVEDSINLENEVISELQYEELLKCVGRLKNELEAPFILKFAQGYTNKEISKMLKITENNVAVRINRAKKALKKMLIKRSSK